MFNLICAEGSTSLISLVKTFDTMLGVYESFCNLKQVSFFFFSLNCNNFKFDLTEIGWMFYEQTGRFKVEVFKREVS